MARLPFIAFLSLASVLSAVAQEKAIPADLVLVHGKVFTGEAEYPYAEALAVRGNRLVEVGSSEQMAALTGPKTRVVDLAGRVVVPGFNDAHYHFGADPQGHSLEIPGGADPSWDQVRTAISAAAAKLAPGTWIFGAVGIGVISDERVQRFALDALTPNHPVLLRTFYGHGYVVNSLALTRFGIAGDEPDPAGGRFDRVADSKMIDGKIWEYAQWPLNRQLSAQVPDEEMVVQLRKMADEAVGHGVTTLQVMTMMPIDRFARLLGQADLPIRVRAIPLPLASAKGRDLSELRGLSRMRAPGTKVTVGGIKWILDGTPFERAAALRQPYKDCATCRGALNFPQAEITKMLWESIDFQQQALFHAAGDRSAEAVLQAMEKIGSPEDWPPRRVRIEHGDGVTGDLISRAVRLGVVVVVNPLHFAPPSMIASRYGANTRFFTLRSYLETGLSVAIGSDGPMNPYLHLKLATAHPSRPRQSITREQAVRAYTQGSAYAEHAELEKGTLAAGKLADFAVLSQDIFTVSQSALEKTRSVLTVVDGKVVHEAKELR